MADTLESIMYELRSKINTEDTSTKVSPIEVRNLIRETVVVMPAGGKGERIRAETQSEGVNKIMISVDGKESMIERAIRNYAEVGISKFVVLTGFLAERVEEHLGDGSRWGVEIRYSRDPGGKKVGSGGAILHALNTGVLDDTLTAIVHNPDDMIIGMKRPYGEVFLEGQARARKNGCIATYIVVPETPYPYSGLIIDRGRVRDIAKYPPITVPAHTGITVFGPEAYDYFRRLIRLDREMSYESVVSPALAKDNLLYAINIPTSTWYPVNDGKGIRLAREALIKAGEISN